MGSTIIFFVVILGFILHTSQSLRFDIQSGNVECISENMKINALSVGQYYVINPNGRRIPLHDVQKVTVRVTSPDGWTSYHRRDDVGAGNFSFTAAETGDYMACFWAPDHIRVITLTVDLVWKSGLAAKDWGDVAKMGSIDTMEAELKKLMDPVSGIHDEMFYLCDREDEMQKLKRLTNSRIFWWKTGVVGKNWGNVAKKGSIDAIELEYNKLMDTVSEIHDEMVYLRDREIQTLKSLTNSRICWRRTSVAAKDWLDVAKKGSIDAMELELKKMMDNVSGILDKMVYLRDRELQTIKQYIHYRIFCWRTGVATKDWVDVAKKGSVDAMELELNKLMDTVSGIHYEMVYLCDREMQTLKRLTNSRIFWWKTGVVWVDAAKKGSVDAMKLELKKLMDTVSGIHDEIVYLRDREIQSVNRVIHSRTRVRRTGWVDLAKKGLLDAIELELKKLMDTLVYLQEFNASPKRAPPLFNLYKLFI